MDSNELMIRWKAYQRKYQYVKKVELSNIIKIISAMLIGIQENE